MIPCFAKITKYLIEKRNKEGEKMLELIIFLGILSLFFGGAYIITGAVLKAVIWLCVLVPVTLFLWGIALACCCTLILIPIGIKLFMTGCRILLL